jgi:hypothetical protein
MGKKDNEKVEKILSTAGPLTDKQAIANEFNKFFSSVGVKLQKNLRTFCAIYPPLPHLSWVQFRRLNSLTLILTAMEFKEPHFRKRK